MSEKQPFAQATVNGGVVSCPRFEKCVNGDKEDGWLCRSCTHNQYGQNVENQLPRPDNFSPKLTGVFTVDNLHGTCQFGDVQIVVASNFSDCKILLNGKECKDVLGFQISASATMITKCSVVVGKRQTTGVEKTG